MEKGSSGIYRKTAGMKKLFVFASSLILVVVAANAQEDKKDPPPPPPKPTEEKVPPVITLSVNNEFYEQNPTVSEISRQGNIITIKLKDGSTEKYDMSKKEEDRSFTEKYGRSPIPPPPPPKVNLTKFKPPIIIAKGEKADDFYERNPSVKEISKQANTITLKMKDGSRREYNVNNKDEMKSFADQYGESSFSSPPPKQKTRA